MDNVFWSGNERDASNFNLSIFNVTSRLRLCDSCDSLSSPMPEPSREPVSRLGVVCRNCGLYIHSTGCASNFFPGIPPRQAIKQSHLIFLELVPSLHLFLKS